jgi:membrane peptidoglycan carboxypeptidase
MQDNQARQDAFGPRSELVIPNQVVSAKTGTTNDLRDNWTVGFTPEYLVITWLAIMTIPNESQTSFWVLLVAPI